jgi:putative peptidoglycan lipid II flippase
MVAPQPDQDSVRSDRSRVFRAATIVGAAFVVSRFLGLVRDAVINFYFDIDSLEANAYFIANRFPETIFLIVAGGALGSAFIPTFSAYFVKDDSDGGWRLFSAIINLVLIATTVIAAIMVLLAPQIVSLFYPDLIANDPELKDTTVSLMRLLLITPIIFGASGVIMSALNARQHFLLPALAPIVYNVGIIGGAVLFAPNVMGLAIGAVVGAIGHLAIQLPGLYLERARYSAILSLRDPGVRQVLRLMLPRVLGLSFGQLNHLLIQFLAQSMTLGSIPALGFAWRIMIMPQGIIGQALGIAAFPTFATLAARSAMDEMRRILADTLRLIIFLSLPAAVLLMMLRRQIVMVLFERGQFEADSTEFVAWALLFFAISLVALAAIEIISRAFYAMQDTWTPVIAGALQLIAMWILGLWLSNQIFAPRGLLVFGGLALGYSLSAILELILLLWLLRKKMGGIDGRHLLDGAWRMAVATLIMATITWLILRQLVDVSAWWQLIVAAIVAACSYLVASLLLQVKELRQLLDYGRQIKKPG